MVMSPWHFPIGDGFYYYKKLTLNTEGILVGGSGTSLGTISQKTHLEYGGYFCGRQRHISRRNCHGILAFPKGDGFYYYKKLTVNTEGILVGCSGTSLGTMVT
jgi:hypothetical protein